MSPRARRVLHVVALAAAAASLVAGGCATKTPAPPSDTAPRASVATASAPVEAGPPPAPPPPPRAACTGAAGVTLFVSPASPAKGAPVRVVAYSEGALGGRLEVRGAANGRPEAVAETRRGGPPYFWTTEVSSSDDALTARFVEGDCEGAPGEKSLAIPLAPRSYPGPRAPDGALWVARRSWDPELENLYSAWIEALFDAPEGEAMSFAALHEVLRDPKRNFLYDHLGYGEDSSHAPVIRPDCADLPYVLRATFAWKLGLPFAMASCSRGGGGAPPDCDGLETQSEPAARKRSPPAEAFGTFVRVTLADRVHSGSARTPFADAESDYYPIALSWDALRPGAVFADPYGHVLVVAKRLRETQDRGGVLYAVDGQPDGTVGRKRFWRGNFLFAKDPALGGPGFKRFRPLSLRAGVVSRAADARLAVDPRWHFSVEQASLDLEAFYDAMDDVLSPTPRDPSSALREIVVALDEQVRTRVISVENGRKFLDKRGPSAPMPEGAKIFEAQGPWEDFSTPSRDLRLLIAIDVATGFPARVARRPGRYLGASADTKVRLEQELARALAERKVQYARSDGQPFELSLAEIVSRAEAFQTAYNPNDCVEHRWGAKAGTDEHATCRARAPAEQRARMEAVRAWFRDRKRPPR
ncbi:MAG: hypothetical protein IPF92_05155 [Myxococcales bacterium]|nr:hypothetical protein [Myxococcales bacterium]